LGKGSGLAPAGAGFYTTKQRRPLTVGVVGSQLVIGRAPAAALRSFASAPSTSASGAQGTLTYRVSLQQLAQLALKRRPSQLEQAILASLGDYSGWLKATTSALTGNATLAFK